MLKRTLALLVLVLLAFVVALFGGVFDGTFVATLLSGHALGGTSAHSAVCQYHYECYWWNAFGSPYCYWTCW